MSWRLRIQHQSVYHYAAPVWSSYNETRLTPITTPWQVTLESQITVAPAAPAQRYWDYWGSAVEAFDLQAPHERLTVVGNSLVETSVTPPLEGERSWADLRSPRITDDYSELLAPTPSGGTSTPGPTPPSARPSSVRAMPGSRCGSVTGWPLTRRTAARLANVTCWWPGVATTWTSRRSRASTTAARPHRSTSPCT